jgi:hypothetical protein
MCTTIIPPSGGNDNVLRARILWNYWRFAVTVWPELVWAIATSRNLGSPRPDIVPRPIRDAALPASDGDLTGTGGSSSDR